MLNVLLCVSQQHDTALVLLSALICLLGCAGTVILMAQAESSSPLVVWQWVLAAAAIFGGSVWSLHFVAMLAFQPDLHIAYDPGRTALSIVASVVGALIAFLLWRLSGRSVAATIAAGQLLGLSIAGMHYLGVDAMRLSGLMFFDRGYVVASVLISMALASVALLRARDLLSIGRRLEVTLWLVLAICGLHFIGMTAVTIAPISVVAEHGLLLGSAQLGFIVGGTSLAILIASLAALLLQQHLTQRTVRELHRMRLLGDLAHEVLFIHRDGRLLIVNRAGLRLFEMTSKQLIGKPIVDLFSDGDQADLLRRTRYPSDELAPQEFHARTGDGGLVPVEFTSRSIEYGGQPATAVALRDLRDRRRDEARIRHLALHDALTDLPNRYLLEERLRLALESAEQDRQELAIVYLDLDRFKPVNDLHGHAVGDALLAQAAKRMLAALRPADTLARVGGDEFVFVLGGQRKPEQVAELVGRVITDLGRPFEIKAQRIEIGASAGIALYPNDGATPDALTRAADTALYRVKAEGRGAFRFFEASMDAHLQARRRLENELGQAIDRGELRLFYQPIVNARTGEIETFEALIRWQHPERGMVSPAEFIPLAEETDQIARIGEWVIETACAEASRWPEPWQVSVNVSPSQLRLSDVAAIAAAALARHGLNPNRLVVEITESVFIQDAARAVAVLTSLRAQGIRLALDDFGAGYSSLGYLQRFKFDKIKVDQSFVRRLGKHADALTIVRAIMNLGQNLGLQVTVEGVETAAQLDTLRDLGCQQMQGFLFGRPAAQIAVSTHERARLRALFADPPVRMCA